ncbi:MAG TPA: hypothetical protein GXX72_07775 [Clostridiaceae bacterium]|nr:hypothetical protein [Clostridiaceae bacterium]
MNIFIALLIAALLGGIMIGLVLLAQKLGASLTTIVLITIFGHLILFATSLILLFTVGRKYYLDRVN